MPRFENHSHSRRRSRSRSRSRYYTSSDDESHERRRSTRIDLPPSGRRAVQEDFQIHIGGPGDVLGGMDDIDIRDLVPPKFRVRSVEKYTRSLADGGSYVIASFDTSWDAQNAISEVDGMVVNGKTLRARKFESLSTSGSAILHRGHPGPRVDRHMSSRDQRLRIMNAMTRTELPLSETTDQTKYLKFQYLWKLGDPLLHEQGEDAFFDELWKDVEPELVKLGKVAKHYIDRLSDTGTVYVQMDTVGYAMSVRIAFDGRWFAGNSIKVNYVRPEEWELQIPRFILDR